MYNTILDKELKIMKLFSKPGVEGLFFQAGERKETILNIDGSCSIKYNNDKHRTENIVTLERNNTLEKFNNFHSKSKDIKQFLSYSSKQEIEKTQKSKDNLNKLLDSLLKNEDKLKDSINKKLKFIKTQIKDKTKQQKLEEFINFLTINEFQTKKQEIIIFLENIKEIYSEDEKIVNNVYQLEKILEEIQNTSEESNNQLIDELKNEINILGKKIENLNNIIENFIKNGKISENESSRFKLEKEKIKNAINNNIILVDNENVCKDKISKNKEEYKVFFYIIQRNDHWYLVIQEKEKIMILDPAQKDSSKTLFKDLKQDKDLKISINTQRIQESSGCCEFYAIDLIFMLSEIQYFSNLPSIFDIFESNNNSMDLPEVFYAGLGEKPFSNGIELLKEHRKILEKKGILGKLKKAKDYTSKQDYQKLSLKEKEEIFDYRIEILNSAKKKLENSQKNSKLLLSKDIKLEDLFLENIEKEIEFLNRNRNKLLEQELIKGGFIYRKATEILIKQEYDELKEDKKAIYFQKKVLLNLLFLRRIQNLKEKQSEKMKKIVRDDAFVSRLQMARNILSEKQLMQKARDDSFLTTLRREENRTKNPYSPALL